MRRNILMIVAALVAMGCGGVPDEGQHLLVEFGPGVEPVGESVPGATPDVTSDTGTPDVDTDGSTDAPSCTYSKDCPAVLPFCVGGACVMCVQDEDCVSGYCEGNQCGEPPCIPDCSGKHCGDDGCGGQCGECPGVSACKVGYCTEVECVDDTDCVGSLCFKNACIPCLVDEDCGPGKQCLASGGVPPPPPICAPECETPSACPKSAPICHNGGCIECLGTPDCPNGLACVGLVCAEPPFYLYVHTYWPGKKMTGVKVHLVDHDVPVPEVAPDYDGDGEPDPYYTPADCYELETMGCSVIQAPTDQRLQKLGMPSSLYQLAVHYKTAGEGPEVVTVNVDIRLSLQPAVDGKEVQKIQDELATGTDLTVGDLWCVAFIDTVAKTITPCVDANGAPKITPNYPAP